MIKSGVLGEKTSNEREKGLLLVSFIFPALAIAIAVIFGGLLGTLNISTAALVTSALLFVLLLTLRQYGLAVTLIIAAHIYIDWYLGLAVVAPAIAIGLFFLLFVIRSPKYPWVAPHALWLWGLLLVLAIAPAIRGAISRYDLAYYYPNIFFGAFLMFWLGMLVAKDKKHLKVLIQVLAVLGTLLAIHTIVQDVTGTVLFGSARVNAALAQVSHFQLSDSNVYRVGSFFQNPDWNGTFFAMTLFLPLGLFIETNSFVQKLLFFVEITLMTIALLFTYSIGAWIGALAGVVVIILMVGRGRHLILVPILIVIVVTILLVIFPAKVNLLFQHASHPVELSLRVGAWQTAVNIIRAFPLTGIGLGQTNYLQKAEPYRAVAQYRPLAHPHNSYLELGAMTGLPVLIVFLTLLFSALWWSWHNWAQVDIRTRYLLGGGMAAIVALSVNSISINGWTLPPLAAMGWLVLGAISSPLLGRKDNG